ncbi:MAG: Coenzyme F420 hydrogenase/dehydrogenase, beta subunit C-terminal domain, partial [Candidatus Heimdallarchaeaceae archaeon]
KTNCSRICPDYTGYYSDLSIGAVGFKTNIIVARNEKATRIVQRAIKEGYLVQKKKPSLFNYLAIKIMGNKKREKIADVFYKLFIG